MTLKKGSLRHWQLIPNFFTPPLPILVLSKKAKGVAEAVCPIGN
jgi:hypothetical protein